MRFEIVLKRVKRVLLNKSTKCWSVSETLVNSSGLIHNSPTKTTFHLLDLSIRKAEVQNSPEIVDDTFASRMINDEIQWLEEGLKLKLKLLRQ